MDVELVLWPSSAAAAPDEPTLTRPLLFDVDVDVEPELLVWRASRADRTPVGAPVTTWKDAAAIATRSEQRIVMTVRERE